MAFFVLLLIFEVNMPPASERMPIMGKFVMKLLVHVRMIRN